QHVGQHVAEPSIADHGGAVGVPGHHERAIVGAHHGGDASQPLVAGIRVVPTDHGRQFAEDRGYLGTRHDGGHSPNIPSAIMRVPARRERIPSNTYLTPVESPTNLFSSASA